MVTPKDEPATQILPKRSSPISALFSLPNTCSSKRKLVGIEMSFTYQDPMNNSYQQTEFLAPDVVEDVKVK